MRRNVAEKYYDCLQCAEQCRHIGNGIEQQADSEFSNINNNSIGNNNNISGNAMSNALIPSSIGAHRVSSTDTSTTSTTNSTKHNVSDTSRALMRINEGKRSGSRSLKSQMSSKSSIKNRQMPLTPAKKRSSLARPVRVHDSFVQPRRSVTGYALQQLQDHQSKRPCSTMVADYEDEEHAEEETAWPIRLRLEQMLELTLPQTKRKKKKKTTMMLMKQQQRSRHGSKDTERLLKVLSINNVDQDNRYNVKRCSVM